MPILSLNWNLRIWSNIGGSIYTIYTRYTQAGVLGERPHRNYFSFSFSGEICYSSLTMVVLLVFCFFPGRLSSSFFSLFNPITIFRRWFSIVFLLLLLKCHCHCLIHRQLTDGSQTSACCFPKSSLSPINP